MEDRTVTFEHAGATVELIRLKPGRKKGYAHLRVSSASNPAGPAHEVALFADGTVRCDCRGHLFRGQCRHGKIALSLVDQTA
jgi:hypothetical protein